MILMKKNKLEVNMKRTGLIVIDNTNMRFSSETTLEGELIIIENKYNKIMALVNDSRCFNKVRLLQAGSLNRQWAKEQAMRVYKVVKKYEHIT